MKKTLLAILATVAMVACSNDEIVREAAPEAIGFDNAFVENSTRSVNDPSFTNTATGIFADFAVYGYVENAVLFPGITVAKTINNDDLSSTWKYGGTQYWVAGAKYNFAAIAPKTNGGWTNASTAVVDGNSAITTSFTFTNNGTTDLLYDEVENLPGKVSGNDAVGFDFRHILSKVKFSFLNNYNVESAKIAVNSIKIENAYTTAEVALSNSATTWSNHSNTGLELVFGNASDNEATEEKENAADATYGCGKTYESLNERFLIPGAIPAVTGVDGITNAYKVTFLVDLYINDVKVNATPYQHTAYVEFTPVAGYAYDIKAEITPANIDPSHAQEPIEFTVNTIGAWTENNIEAPGYEAPVTPDQN